MIYQEELIERNKIIVDYLGGNHYVGIETKTFSDSITVRGNFINELRDKQKFVVGGYENSMMMNMMKFHSDWNWIMWLYEYLESKGYYAHIDPWSIAFIEYITGKELEIINFEFDSDNIKIENYYYAITELINKIKLI